MEERAERKIGKDAAQYIVLNERKKIVVRRKREVDVRSWKAYPWMAVWISNGEVAKLVEGSQDG